MPDNYDQREELHAASLNRKAGSPATTPKWSAAGEPDNLAAAAADAGEWLALIERAHAAGRWKFSQSDSLSRLQGCRTMLQKYLGSDHVPGVGKKVEPGASNA